MLAAAAGLPGTYRAYLSDSSRDAIDQLAGARGWVRVDGRPFADTPADVAAGEVFYPAVVDENGGSVDPRDLVFTGSDRDGRTANQDCGGSWSSGSGNARVGRAGMVGTLFNGNLGVLCGDPGRLYCFGVDQSTPARVHAPASARYAFVSSTGWPMMGGIGGADAHCQGLASSAGLPGTYRALIADSSTVPASRFSLSGPPWMRVDGVLLAATPDDLMDERTLSAFGVDETGTHIYPGVFVGSDSPRSSVGDSCNDWTGGTGMFDAADGGNPWQIGTANGFFNGPGYGCRRSDSVYCLQE